jgi:hypothetical protein
MQDLSDDLLLSIKFDNKNPIDLNDPGKLVKLIG